MRRRKYSGAELRSHRQFRDQIDGWAAKLREAYPSKDEGRRLLVPSVYEAIGERHTADVRMPHKALIVAGLLASTGAGAGRRLSTTARLYLPAALAGPLLID